MLKNLLASCIFVAFLAFSTSGLAAGWVVTISVDPDKTDVGVISAVYTDTDSTTFTYSARIQAVLSQLNAFVSAAVSARNAWQTRKANQTSYMSTAVARFQAAGETATAGVSQ